MSDTTYLLPLSPDQANIHRQALISYVHECYRQAETEGLPDAAKSLLWSLAQRHIAEADRLTAMIQRTANLEQEHYCHAASQD
jgi:hypothetical protein